MRKTDLLSMCKVDNMDLLEVLNCHHEQIISDDIRIPVYKILYRYTTQRNNKKESIKYIFVGEESWDIVEPSFYSYIADFNEKNPNRPISNVEILDIDYLGELIFELE